MLRQSVSQEPESLRGVSNGERKVSKAFEFELLRKTFPCIQFTIVLLLTFIFHTLTQLLELTPFFHHPISEEYLHKISAELSFDLLKLLKASLWSSYCYIPTLHLSLSLRPHFPHFNVTNSFIFGDLRSFLLFLFYHFPWAFL